MLVRRITAELASEKSVNATREKRKDEQIDDCNRQIVEQKVHIKKLMSKLEESVVDQIKIPQIQLLHTELQRLKDMESKIIQTMARRKEAIKAYQ